MVGGCPENDVASPAIDQLEEGDVATLESGDDFEVKYRRQCGATMLHTTQVRRHASSDINRLQETYKYQRSR